MTKAAGILICPTVDLRQLPPAEVDVVRRFLFDHVRGMDAESHRRWCRMWGAVWNSAAGEGTQLLRIEERSGRFHRRHRAILERLFQSQERFRQLDKLHDWLKVGAGFVTWGEGRRGQLLPVPRSTAFPECSEDEMREAHTAMVDFLHTDRAQRFLWRHLRRQQREDMLESVLAWQEEGAC